MQIYGLICSLIQWVTVYSSLWSPWNRRCRISPVFYFSTIASRHNYRVAQGPFSNTQESQWNTQSDSSKDFSGKVWKSLIFFKFTFWSILVYDFLYLGQNSCPLKNFYFYAKINTTQSWSSLCEEDKGRTS